MKTEITIPPSLAELLRWIADMPAAFSAEPVGFPNGKIAVRAVVCDLYETVLGERPSEPLLQAFSAAALSKVERNRLRWVLGACWVFWHPFFRQKPFTPDAFKKLMVLDLADLAAVMPADNLLSDQDRREELARLAMAATRTAFPGESWDDFKDRLTQVDSIESHRVIAQATIKEKKAREDRARREREVREEMARKAAAEAAAKESRE
ncbi:MAG: hypothetical protein WCT04_17450 [Planctomycetota bacterium]